ncbi:phosphatidylglycerophosphate synthase [Bifidobacterium sp. WCA-178-WT-4B]|nr:phosphatidylglycerophosphate synthase [Bifidobacterium sp. WCA-178-WT-4B]
MRHAVRTNVGVKGDTHLQRVKCMRKRIGGMFATHDEPWKIRGGRSWRLTTIFAISYVTKVSKE